MTKTTFSSERLCRISQVLDRVHMSRSWVYEQVQNQRFPAPIRIGPNSVAWLESDIDAWLAERIALSRGTKQ